MESQEFVSFTELNTAFPNDCFPLPKIGMLIIATTNHEIMRILEAFISYKQIKMDLANEEKPPFITERGT